MRDIDLRFSFIVVSLCGLGIRVIGASQNNLEMNPSVSILQTNVQNICISSLQRTDSVRILH